MSKKAFLSTLEESLRGNIPMENIGENLQYYKEYIEQYNGSEENALEELGDPRLIARTIIDSFKASKGPMADYYTEQARKEESESSTYGRFSGFDDLEDGPLESSGKDFFGKIRKVLNIVLGILIVLVVITFAFAAIRLAIRILLPVLAVVLLVKVVSELIHKK